MVSLARQSAFLGAVGCVFSDIDIRESVSRARNQSRAPKNDDCTNTWSVCVSQNGSHKVTNTEREGSCTVLLRRNGEPFARLIQPDPFPSNFKNLRRCSRVARRRGASWWEISPAGDDERAFVEIIPSTTSLVGGKVNNSLYKKRGWLLMRPMKDDANTLTSAIARHSTGSRPLCSEADTVRAIIQLVSRRAHVMF